MMRGVAVLSGLLLGLGSGAVLAELAPAETPPSSFRGQQYVDSKGCVFIRAGADGDVLWIPRVNRSGRQLCNEPPSGKRVPIVGEAGAAEVPTEKEPAAGKPAPVEKEPAAAKPAPAESATSETRIVVVSFLVAVGSFRQPGNAAKTQARLAALSYPSVRGWLPGTSTDLITVLAGPFDTAEIAAQALRELRGAGYPDAILIKP
jgi:hypothetical protein